MVNDMHQRAHVQEFREAIVFSPWCIAAATICNSTVTNWKKILEHSWSYWSYYLGQSLIYIQEELSS